jgi:hypothetical protein
VTSRYLPIEHDGDSLPRCTKINDLQAQRKRKSKEHVDKKMREPRTKKKESRNQMNLRMMGVDRTQATPWIAVRDS